MLVFAVGFFILLGLIIYQIRIMHRVFYTSDSYTDYLVLKSILCGYVTIRAEEGVESPVSVDNVGLLPYMSSKWLHRLHFNILCYMLPQLLDDMEDMVSEASTLINTDEEENK